MECGGNDAAFAFWPIGHMESAPVSTGKSQSGVVATALQRVECHRLAEANAVLTRLKRGEVRGAAVLRIG